MPTDAAITVAEVQSRLTPSRAARVILLLCLILLGVFLIALSSGSEHVPLHAILERNLSHEQSIILYQIRLPRILLALGTGAALAVAGAAFQALLRNPLADPYVLGVSSGAAVGAIAAIALLPTMALARPILGFVGAGLATLFVFYLGRRGEDPARLILAGVVVSTLLSSGIMLVVSLVNDLKLRNITFWLLGDLSSGSTATIAPLFAVSLIGVVALSLNARALNLMMTGERDAFSLGVETSRVRWIVFATASLLTAAAVSAGGAIGFVGLVIPHLVRLGSSSDNRLVIPGSAIGGAILVLLADTGARTVVAPRELPTGAILALLGAPVLGYLLVGKRFFFRRPASVSLIEHSPAHPLRVLTGEPVLSLKGIRFSFDHEVLSGIDLELRGGEILALLGPNGAGKSTLLSIAEGRLEPAEGTVLLEGVPIGSFSRREIARRIGLVSQAGDLDFHVTALEYVLTGRYAHSTGAGFDTDEDVNAALDALAAMDAMNLAARPFNRLSSGEKQRVNIARAFAQQPSALLLDEPTAHLDLTHQVALLDLVREMAANHRIGALLVTHEIHLARRYSDRAALIKDGRVLSVGPTAEILTTEAMRELFSLPANFDYLKLL